MCFATLRENVLAIVLTIVPIVFGARQWYLNRQEKARKQKRARRRESLESLGEWVNKPDDDQPPRMYRDMS